MRLLVVFILIATTLIAAIAFSATSEKTYLVEGVEIPCSWRVVTITVEPGDTLWDIQKELTTEKTDVRELMFYFQKINGTKTIQAHETYLFLSDKPE